MWSPASGSIPPSLGWLPYISPRPADSARDPGIVSVLWLMNDQGICISASNFDQPESFVGTDYADRDYFQAAGMDGCPAKPVNFAELVAVLGKWRGKPELAHSTPTTR